MTYDRTRRAMRAVLGAMAAIAMTLTALTARADDPPPPWLAQPPAAPAPAASPEPGRLPWRVSLMVVASAALGAAAVWVRSRKGGLAKLTSSRELRVISSVRVGPKGHLVLAGIGDRALLLGVTDNSVRRIAWLPAEAIAAPSTEAPAAEGAPSPFAAALNARESGPAPTKTSAAHAKGGFADILRKLGGRPVDAAPGEDTSPAAALAALRRDSVQWSQNAGAAARPAAPLLGAKPDSSTADLEQQAAGILKRRSRKRA